VSLHPAHAHGGVASPQVPFLDSNSPSTQLRLLDATGARLGFWGLAMSSEDPSHNKQRLVVLFRNADNVPQRKSPDHEYFDVLSSPLREAAALSDDQWKQRSIDNILALLEANAKLRRMAVKLSDMLETAGIANMLDKAARGPAQRQGNLRRKGQRAD
jgi:hypothetical protein